MRYLNNITKIKDVTTAEGEVVEVFELSSNIENTAFNEWATHFRQDYCRDDQLELLVCGTGMTKQEYLLTYKFPDEKSGFGPGTRLGDFAELLISDLLKSDCFLEDLFNPERKTVVITTPEKLLYIICQDESIIDSVGQLIFDEGHLFDDEERGATYELLISSILKKVDLDVQKKLISAIIPNVDEINNWFTKGNGVAFSGDDISVVDKLPAVLNCEHIGGSDFGYLYFINKEDYSTHDFFVP